jgi:hypothetical protein
LTFLLKELLPVATVRAPRLAPGTIKPLQRCIELWLARREGLAEVTEGSPLGRSALWGSPFRVSPQARSAAVLDHFTWDHMAREARKLFEEATL